VLVVGAGLSGLSAAKDLLAAGKSVHIPEARGRVGGRVLNAHLGNGGITEVGAEFVGPTQDRVLNLISTLGLQTFDTYGDGNSTLYENNVRKTYAADPTLGGIPPVDDASLLQAGVAQFTLNDMAASTNVSAPWAHPNATQWDGITFGTWLDAQISLPDARFLFDLFSTSVFSAESTELSLLYVVTYIASAGNKTTLGAIE
jgi:monoamine oxidase